MNLWAWLGMLGIIILTLLPFRKKTNRSEEAIKKAIVTISIVLGIIVAVLAFGVNYLFALLIGFLALIVFDKKTYTRKRLLIYGAILFILGIASYSVLRDNPEYVLNHLKENPETTSLYMAENGQEKIAYEADVIRPLASTVKILVMVEYAMQIDEGKLDKDSPVSLDDLNQYYFKNTDGHAHEEWLSMLDSEEKINKNEVRLHDVAKGMATYSSNANTDYLIDLLGVDAINERAQTLGLTQHEDVYPIVSALLIPTYIKSESWSEKQLIKELEKLSMDEYRSLATELSKEMKEGTIKIEEETFDSSMAVQRVWSDRLIGASATDYGTLLTVISNDQLPEVAAKTVRDLLEWPMQLHEGNRERFVHLGAKGGSTAFVMNNALYAEDHDGNRIEIVLLTDDLNVWQGILVRKNMNSFEAKLLESEEYRQEVQEELTRL